MQTILYADSGSAAGWTSAGNALGAPDGVEATVLDAGSPPPMTFYHSTETLPPATIAGTITALTVSLAVRASGGTGGNVTIGTWGLAGATNPTTFAGANGTLQTITLPVTITDAAALKTAIEAGFETQLSFSLISGGGTWAVDSCYFTVTHDGGGGGGNGVSAVSRHGRVSRVSRK